MKSDKPLKILASIQIIYSTYLIAYSLRAEIIPSVVFILIGLCGVVIAAMFYGALLKEAIEENYY